MRCDWCGEDKLYVAYHDDEWGVPVFDDQKLFEFLILEGAQAGLSWITILKRREGYRDAFAGFDVECVARFSKRDTARAAEVLRRGDRVSRSDQRVALAALNARSAEGTTETGGPLPPLPLRFRRDPHQPQPELRAARRAGAGLLLQRRAGAAARHEPSVHLHRRAGPLRRVAASCR